MDFIAYPTSNLNYGKKRDVFKEAEWTGMYSAFQLIRG